MELKVSDDIHLYSLAVSHAHELFHAVESSRQSLSIYMPWAKSLTDVKSAENYIRSRIEITDNGSKWFAIYFKGQLTGVFGIKYIEPDSRASELGYWLSNYGRGNGIVYQVLKVILPYMASCTNAKTVEFHCLESNEASIKIVNKIGAALIRYLPNTIDVENKDQKLGVYSLEL